MTNPLARILGRPTIHPVPFFVGKMAVVVLAVVPLLQLLGLRIATPVPGTRAIAAVLAVIGVAVLVSGSRALGSSLRVGLPAEDTVLQTRGIYRYSRHPIYLSLFVIAVAACLYCPHPVVIAAALLAIPIHHFIALSEERFLEGRFGNAWLEHKARVPRYLGLPR